MLKLKMLAVVCALTLACVAAREMLVLHGVVVAQSVPSWPLPCPAPCPK
jgi:hypothetical protein